MINRFTLAGLLAVLAVVGLGALAVLAAGGGSTTPRARPTAPPTPARRRPRPRARAPRPTAPPPPRPRRRRRRPRTWRRRSSSRAAPSSTSPTRASSTSTASSRAADYQVNPPTSGTHAPTWAEDGIYGPGTTPTLGTLVHTLEHGRIDIQYRRARRRRRSRSSTALYNELDNGYHLLLFENRRRCRSRSPRRPGTSCSAARRSTTRCSTRSARSARRTSTKVPRRRALTGVALQWRAKIARNAGRSGVRGHQSRDAGGRRRRRRSARSTWRPSTRCAAELDAAAREPQTSSYLDLRAVDVPRLDRRPARRRGRPRPRRSRAVSSS